MSNYLSDIVNAQAAAQATASAQATAQSKLSNHLLEQLKDAPDSKFIQCRLAQMHWNLRSFAPQVHDKLETYWLDKRQAKVITRQNKNGMIFFLGNDYQVRFTLCGPADLRAFPENQYFLSFRKFADPEMPAFVLIRPWNPARSTHTDFESGE